MEVRMNIVFGYFQNRIKLYGCICKIDKHKDRMEMSEIENLSLMKAWNIRIKKKCKIRMYKLK